MQARATQTHSPVHTRISLLLSLPPPISPTRNSLSLSPLSPPPSSTHWLLILNLKTLLSCLFPTLFLFIYVQETKPRLLLQRDRSSSMPAHTTPLLPHSLSSFIPPTRRRRDDYFLKAVLAHPFLLTQLHSSLPSSLSPCLPSSNTHK